MANRFPLTLDGTTIKELPSGDNLDLTGSSISISGSQGTDGQVLTSTGSGIAWEDAASGGGGARWTQIATSTISSEVDSVEFTSLGSYDEYELRFVNLLGAVNGGQLVIQFDYGSGYQTSGYRYKMQLFGGSNASYDYDSGTNSSWAGSVRVSRSKLPRETRTARAKPFGNVRWTGSSSLWVSEFFGNSSEDDYGLDRTITLGAHGSNENTAPTKIKLAMFQNGVYGGTDKGLVSGKFTLYALRTINFIGSQNNG
jgi:hypothetical protein